MFTTAWIRRVFRPLILIVVLATALGPAGAATAAGCRTATGKIKLVAVTGPADCPSGAGVCAATTYSGTLAGTGFFVGTSLTPTVDTPTTSVVLLTGDQTITVKDGSLLTKDAIVLQSTAPGNFAEVDTVIGGTGQWLGASGVLRAQGTFTIAAGGQGEYTGELCRP